MSLPLITITTDFGLEDGYVGMMKGVIYSINPAALLVDLTHAVEPQNVAQGAFLLYNAYRHFPPGATHLAVVDPGVGTDRRAICLAVPEIGCFVGPDNGLFSYIIDAESNRGAALSAYELSNPSYHRMEISHTFHGRDIFAPVAAHLSRGEPPENLGNALDITQLVKLKNIWPHEKTSGKKRIIEGQIVHIDHFGNLISNIPASMLGNLTPSQRDRIEANFGLLTITYGIKAIGLKYTYGEGSTGDYLILVDSGGFVEVACVNDRADAYNNANNRIVKLGAKLTLTIPSA